MSSDWLRDKFGITWQIMPEILDAMMSELERAIGVDEYVCVD